jgi:predicted RecB family nuclease
MHPSSHGLSLTATDLSNFLGCRHRTALDMEVAAGTRRRAYFIDPILDVIRQRGLDHEKSYVERLRENGRRIVDLSHLRAHDESLSATLDAMRAGADVIVQGALGAPPWFGRPDLLERVPRASTLGDWSYEISDTKLSRETHAGSVVQLGLYSELLSRVQGFAPEWFRIVTPDPERPIQSFRSDEYGAYIRLVRRQMAALVTQPPEEIAAANYPEPVALCDVCHWSTLCRERRCTDDHLSLVAGITPVQKRELESHGVHTLTDLGRLPLPIPFRPDRGSDSSYARVRDQARLQLESRDRTPPLYELRDVVDGQGLSRLPEPSAGDIFLDLEGDNLAVEGGREYLFGLVTIGGDGEPEYRAYWGLTDREERSSFEAVMDLIGTLSAAHPGMHVYHYAPYETTAFKRLMGRYATREDELDGMLRAGRFVDLFAVVHQGLRVGIERYSIKNLESLYGFVRAVPLNEANPALRAFGYSLAVGATGLLDAEVRRTVEGYNRDDCISTLRLRDWLESLRDTLVAAGTPLSRPTLNAPDASAELSEKQQRVETLRQQLLAGIDVMPVADGTDRARWLLAYLLDFHRREDKAGWWKYYSLCAATDEELMDEPEAVAGLEHLDRIELITHARTKRLTGRVVDRYRYPAQEMGIRRDDDLHTVDETTFGKVVGVDRARRTIDVRKGKTQADHHPSAAFAYNHVSCAPMEEALIRIGDAVAQSAGFNTNGVARALLLREPPRLTSGPFRQRDGGDATRFAVDIVNQLEDTVLAIQGPPGSGKTFTGARMICALVAQGKRVGVTGPGHKAISNLLGAIRDAARELGRTVRIVQKLSREEDPGTILAGITPMFENADVLEALRTMAADVVGATPWLWARTEMAGAIDVLVVDEAGQVSLANAIAVSGAASSMVLLGDPQQLDQPLKGSHPDSVDASALQHLLGAHLTIPSDAGIFLPVTWRLSPAICAFTSEVFYESRLVSRGGLESQILTGAPGISGSGLWHLDVAHDGCTNSSDQEVEAVTRLVARLTAPGSMWVSDTGAESQLVMNDVLIVSPFNAQVGRLLERLPAGARVGTVDKFQGQAAPVVIYSMATSRPEDAPRGMEFLYSLNRLNVATSRAKCAVIVVASPRLYEPACHSPRQMKLANALCRYREMAQPMMLRVSAIS